MCENSHFFYRIVVYLYFGNVLMAWVCFPIVGVFWAAGLTCSRSPLSESNFLFACFALDIPSSSC